jgi:chromosome segregation and condensation protein ScpB
LAEDIRDFIEIKEVSLSRVAYETLAIIALNQPITKHEIERIRGISNADSMLNKLRSKKLIRVMGRKSTVGKPRLYGVGMMFFKHFGIRSLKELKEYSRRLLELGHLPIDEEKLEESTKASGDLLPENEMGEIAITTPPEEEIRDEVHEYDDEEEYPEDEFNNYGF